MAGYTASVGGVVAVTDTEGRTATSTDGNAGDAGPTGQLATVACTRQPGTVIARLSGMLLIVNYCFTDGNAGDAGATGQLETVTCTGQPGTVIACLSGMILQPIYHYFSSFSGLIHVLKPMYVVKIIPISYPLHHFYCDSSLVQNSYCYTPDVGICISVCVLTQNVWQSLGDSFLLYFLLHFNFVYHTNKAPYNKSS